MRIYLIRHGDALAEGERPLSERGIAHTKASARGLKKLGAKPALILHSPLLRAKETAKILASEFSLPAEKTIPSDVLAPSARPELILRELRRLATADEDEIILVGHLPDLGELLTYLVWGEPLKEIPIKKSGVALIEIPASNLGKGAGILSWLLTAEQLSLITSAKE